MMRTTGAMCTLLAAAIIGASAGCSSSQRAPVSQSGQRTLRVTHHVGGTHYCTLIHQGVWLQLFGTSLLVINPDTAAAVHEVSFGPFGETGPAVDMLVHDGRLFVVIESQQVIELSLELPGLPRIVQRVDAQRLGMAPLRLEVVAGELYVLGPDGVVRFSDGKRIFTAEESVGSVAMSAYGLVACLGRRVHRVDEDRYVGSASRLIALPEAIADAASIDGKRPALLFLRRGESATLVGLMTADLRELESTQATVAVPGEAHAARFIDDQIWVTGDDGITVLEARAGVLKEVRHVAIVGARDVGRLGAGAFAVAGTFGRAVYKPESANSRDNNPFPVVHREPGHLMTAESNGQYVAAGGREGTWMYLISSRVELTNQAVRRLVPPRRAAATVSAQASLAEDGRSARIAYNGGQTWEHREPADAVMHCIVAVDGEFWIGHDRGITVLRAEPVAATGEIGGDPVVGRLRIPGPVRYLFPLLVGGGASYVSEFGGFGVAAMVNERAAAR